MFRLNRRQFGALLGASALTVTGQPGLAQDGKTLTIRFYDDPAGYDPANIFRIENENLAFNIFSGLTTYDSETGNDIYRFKASSETAKKKRKETPALTPS